MRKPEFWPPKSKKTANETLATNLRLVRKIEKLEKHGQQQGSTRTNSGNAVEENGTLRSQSPPKLSNNVGVFTPLAKSLAGLGLKTLNTVPPVTDDARPDDKSGRVTSGRGLPTIPEAVDSKKRAGEKCSLDGNQAKRSRLTNGSSDAAENLVGRQLPAGAQDPFIRRPTSNTGLRTRSSSRRSMAGRGSMITQEPKENPTSSLLPPRVQRVAPEMALSPRRTNRIPTGLPVPQRPRSKIAKPGSSQLPKPLTGIPRTAGSSKQAVTRPRLAPGEEAKKPTTNQQECKMQ